MLLLAGQADHTVDPGNTLRLAERLRAAGASVRAELDPGISRRATVAGAPAAIQLVDRLLSRYPTIDLETLFYEPHKAADYLQRRVGFKFELDDFPAAHEDRYRKALLAILRLVERGSFANNTEMFSFAVGGTYSTTSGGAGLLALGEG